ncbi:hypothetical protein Hamer_G011581, partial [Homarus americanus]
TWVGVVLTLVLVTIVHLVFIKVKELPDGGLSHTLLEVVRTILRLDASDLSCDYSVRPIMTDYGSYIPSALASSLDPALRKLGQSLEVIPYNYDLGLSM